MKYLKIVLIFLSSLLVAGILFLLWQKELLGVSLIFVLISLIATILFLLWQKNKFRSTTATQPEPSSPAKKSRWRPTQQAFAIIGLLTTLIIVLFLDQAKEIYNEFPLITVSFILLLLIFCIGGTPEKTIITGRKIAKVVLLILLIAYIFWPAITEKFPELTKINLSNRQTKAGASISAQHLPANAKFVKTLAPKEKIYLTRTNMDAPPPERWARNIRGEVYKVADWPTDEKTYFTENTWPAKAEIFIVLPSGQNFVASADDPNNCPVEKKFGPKVH